MIEEDNLLHERGDMIVAQPIRQISFYRHLTDKVA